MIEWWLDQWNKYMPHIHCLGGDWSLAYQNISNDAFTIIQYVIIFFVLYHIGNWGKRGGQWYKLCTSLAFVFMFCSANYLMNIIVFYNPVYYVQVVIKYIGNIMFLKALYHLFKIGRTPLQAMINAFRNTIKDCGF